MEKKKEEEAKKKKEAEEELEASKLINIVKRAEEISKQRYCCLNAVYFHLRSSSVSIGLLSSSLRNVD